MILSIVTNFVETNSHLTVGTDLFMNQFPATGPDTAICFYESGGVAPGRTFGGVAYESPSIQVVSRGSTYEVARLNAQVIWNLIEGLANDAQNGIIAGKSQQSPFSIGTDDSGRYQVSCNYFIEKEVGGLYARLVGAASVVGLLEVA